MKAFSSIPEKSCPAELKSISNDLVQKCEGLPLGIVTLGAVMSAKILEKSEWGRVYNSLSWELRTNPLLEVVKSILLLSFKDLPYRLKYCFLYCCIFPEAYVIQRSRLVRLWIAEGLVEQVKGHSLEETAESYLMELIYRSMLQVVERHSNGRPKACKMHDLLREVAISISEEEKFCTIVTEQEVAKETRVRRLSLQALNGQISSKDLSKVRTFFVFLPKVIPSSFISLPSGFRMLTVLDFKDVPIVELPEEVAYCFNLRYLNLKGTKLKALPRSIGKLRSLQTLDIRNTGNLKFEYVSGTWAPLDACEFKNLQVLDCVEVESEVLLRGLKHTTQLKRLGLTKVREAYGNDLCNSIERMKLLRYLFVMTIDEDELLQMDALLSPPPFLDTLFLIGKLEKLPGWFHSLHSITCIRLHWSRLKEDFLPSVQALPNLARLFLINAYSGTKLHFRSGFQKLSYLELRFLPQLKEITIEKGVMPCIQELDIESCVELKILPSGIEHLSSLQELSLWSMTTEFLKCIRGEQAVDRNKVKHISKIGHYSETQSGSWSYEPLS
ncbi:NB-ARC domain, LRR domain containing protein [Trema orientale]|uniref:NB-ARC domain, LRR domain containing protein n=1 Tax=Trema orientale TaxID=63057 RepID=A0A2P5E8Z1_TREOI|nr:NB-ARC domain, LRR domain containing protein [Trema orientale]